MRFEIIPTPPATYCLGLYQDECDDTTLGLFKRGELVAPLLWVGDEGQLVRAAISASAADEVRAAGLELESDDGDEYRWGFSA